jgi:hypothetical protein
MKDNEFWQASYLALLRREEPMQLSLAAKLADKSVEEYRARFRPEEEE